MCKCLFCYKELNEGERDFHARCARKFFGTTTAPTMDYTRKDMDRLAEQIIRSQTTLTGVQPKLSLNLQKHEGSQRLTVVGLWGAYIFKPQTAGYPELPENEDLTMHLAEIAGINTAKHSLIRLADNSLGYLTRRMDRDEKGNKLAMEDFCQLTERQTEYKYRSSYEQIAKTIAKFSSVPGLDLVNFYEMVMFCWLTGNNDMHLKNFSLLSQNSGNYELSPAYDLLNVAIANPNDKEELALTLNGKEESHQSRRLCGSRRKNRRFRSNRQATGFKLRKVCSCLGTKNRRVVFVRRNERQVCRADLRQDRTNYEIN